MMDLSQSTRMLCFGRKIDVDIYYYDKANKDNKAVSIITPMTGLKPDITVSLNVIPSNNVTNMTVVIKNMIIDFDISRAYYMKVSMGYETCGVAVYESIIFRSYQATPNPDGVYVFEGVVVGDSTGYQNDIGIVEEDPFILQFNDCGNENIYAFISYILNGEYNDKVRTVKGRKPSYKFDITCDNDDLQNQLMNSDIQINKDIKGFTTPLSRAVYAKLVLTSYASDNGIPLAVVLDGNKFIIKSVSPELPESPDTAIDIIGYTSASYNGAILSVTLPYFPAINAGSLLRIDASFVTQIGLPNSNGNDVLKKNYSWSMYRVMRFSVNFSTVHDNTMTIEAFPVPELGKASVLDENNKKEKKKKDKKKRQVYGSYFKETVDKEYKTRNNYGEIIVGDIGIDNNIVAAKKTDVGRYFGGAYVDYNPIGNFDVISYITKYYDNDNYMIKCTSFTGEVGLVASMQYIFPVVFAATWYASKADSKVALSDSSFPINFSAGYLVIPQASVINANNAYIPAVLMDFIKIYREHNNNHEYDNFLKVWQRMIDINNGDGKIEIVSRDPGE